MSDFPKASPPRSKRILERWIMDKAATDGAAYPDLRRRVTWMVVAASLSKLVDAAGSPLFVLKGGVGMQLRFGARARPSLDYDAAFREDLKRLEFALPSAVGRPMAGFIITPGAFDRIGDTGAVRVMLRVTCLGRDWSTVPLEVSPAEGSWSTLGEADYVSPSPDLSIFGLDPQADVPCLPVRYQIAQKLHACTEVVPDGGDNGRYRDLLDLLLLEELVVDDDWGRCKQACLEVFASRGKHSWPPAVTIFPAWVTDYPPLARTAGFATTAVREAAAAVSALIQRIDSAE